MVAEIVKAKGSGSALPSLFRMECKMKRISKDNTINSAVLFKLKMGWKIRRGSKHWVLGAPNGRKLSIPSTPSDIRSAKNFLRILKHIEAQGGV